MSEADFLEVQIGQINGVHIWNMPVFEDLRGRLFKAYVSGEENSFPVSFETVEHFFTESKLHVFRGMHFQQSPHAARKIISLVRGSAEVFLLDARPESPTFGNLQKEKFEEALPKSIYIPTGVALGYLILAEGTTISYRMDVAFCGRCDAGIDPEVLAAFIGIPLDQTIRSQRDLALQMFSRNLASSQCSR